MVFHSSSQPDRSDIFDAEAMSCRLQGDGEHVAELIEMFLEVYADMLAEIRTAVDVQDTGRLRESAHRFKGALSQVHAPAASTAALQLEQDGRDGRVSQADEHLDRLIVEVARLCDVLEQFNERAQ